MKSKSKNIFLSGLIAIAMIFTMALAFVPNMAHTAYAAGSYSVGFAIKEATEVYFAETGNNKVQNTATGNDGKIAHMPELYRTDTLDYRFDGWFIANTDTQVTEDTVLDSDVTLVDRWTYTAFDSDYKVSTITINNSALALGTKQGEYTATVATANVDGITATSGTTFTIYKGLNKSGDALVGDEEVEIGKNYSVATTITLKNGYKFDDQIHFYASNGLAADWKFRGNFWTTRWTTEATQVEVIINFVQGDKYYFTQQPESREFENFTEYHYWYALHEDEDMEGLDSVQLQYFNNGEWALFGPATMVVSPYQNRTIKFRLAASYEHGTIYSDPWTVTWAVLNPTIDDVALGIDTPANGNAPTYAVPTGSRFKLASINNTYTQTGVKWTGSVSGDLEVGNATFNNTEDYTVSIKLVAQEGYSFDIANIAATVNANVATVTGTSEEVTVSYTFEKATPATHLVYFNSSLHGTGSMETQIINEGAEYVLPECTFTPNTNYEFAAWSISGELKKPGDIIVVNSDMPVFAVWQASSTPVSEGFTTQPTGGTTAAGSYFTVSFEVDDNINYNSISVLEYNENSGTWTGLEIVRDNIATIIDGKIKKFGFYVEDVSNKLLRLYAYRDGSCVAKSDTFTVNWTPSEFTKQPQGTTIVNGSTYTFTWDTTFDARFRILYWDAETNDWSSCSETTGHSFSVKQDTTQSITYKVVADIPYTMSNGGTNYVWDVAESQSFIVSWVEELPTAYLVVYGVGEGQGSGDSEEVEEGTEYTLDSYESVGNMVAPNGQQFAYWSIRLGSAMSEETAKMQAGGKITITANTYIIAIWEDIPAQQKTLTGITAEYFGGNIVVGNKINGSKINLTLVYDDKSTEKLSSDASGVTYWNGQNQINDPVNYVFNQAGSLTITVKYNNFQADMTVNVVSEAATVTGITATYTGTIYVNEVIDGKGFTIKLVYTDQSEYTLTDDELLTVVKYYLDGNVVNNPEDFKFTTAGAKTITIKYASDESIYFDLQVNVSSGYVITFRANGGSGIMTGVENIHGEYELPACTFDAPAGKKFKCWSVAGVEKEAGATIEVTENTYVDAVWKDKATEATISELDAETGITTEIFKTAKTNGDKVVLNIGTATITFDLDAVNAIGTANSVDFRMTTSDDVTDVDVAGAVKTINITVGGFTAGTAKVEIPFTTEVANGKVAKVYYVNGGTKTDMNATLENGKITFETTHFSEYVIAIEDETTTPETPAKTGLGAGAIVGIIIAVLAVLGGGAFCVYWFVIRKKKLAK